MSIFVMLFDPPFWNVVVLYHIIPYHKCQLIATVFGESAKDTSVISVDEKAWYYEDVYKATEYGLMLSGGGDQFSPEDKATRAQVIQTIYNMSDKPLADYSGAFDDVKQHAWYANAVSWGLENGVVMESPDGMFGPSEQTPREEIIVYLYRYMGSPEADGDQLDEFADAAQISPDAQNAVAWAVEEDILVTHNGEIRPLDAATRAELASILVRIYEKFMSN